VQLTLLFSHSSLVFSGYYFIAFEEMEAKDDNVHLEL